MTTTKEGEVSLQKGYNSVHPSTDIEVMSKEHILIYGIAEIIRSMYIKQPYII